MLLQICLLATPQVQTSFLIILNPKDYYLPIWTALVQKHIHSGN